MYRRIKIRCDGESGIGLGHIVRCISLAHMLKGDFEICFYCISIPESLNEEILSEGWGITKLQNESDFEKELTGNEIVVLDGYQFDSAYQKRIKEKARKLVCIDDFHDQYFYADLIINHAPGVTIDNYESEPYTKYLLGPKYALLRPEFLHAKIEEKQFIDEIKNIFICFGGSDVKNLTSKIISWLPSNNFNVTIITGNAFLYNDDLGKVIAKRNGELSVRIKSSLAASDMVQEIQKTDLAIVPASGILFEAISTGIPVISGYYVDNQKGIYNGFKYLGCFIDAKDFERKNFLEAFKTVNHKSLALVLKNQTQAIDGLSKNRIYEEFKNQTNICV